MKNFVESERNEDKNKKIKKSLQYVFLWYNIKELIWLYMENLFKIKIKFNFLYNNKELRRKEDGNTKKLERKMDIS